MDSLLSCAMLIDEDRPDAELYTFKDMQKTPANVRLRTMALRTFIGALSTTASSVTFVGPLATSRASRCTKGPRRATLTGRRC